MLVEVKEEEMTRHDFGEKNKDVLVMFHPLGVWWDIFEYVIPELSNHFHVIIPAIPGHDPEVPLRDFSSVEEISEEIENWLRGHTGDHLLLPRERPCYLRQISLSDRREYLIFAPYKIESGFLDRIQWLEYQAAPFRTVNKVLECQQYSKPFECKH